MKSYSESRWDSRVLAAPLGVIRDAEYIPDIRDKVLVLLGLNLRKQEGIVLLQGIFGLVCHNHAQPGNASGSFRVSSLEKALA